MVDSAKETCIVIPTYNEAGNIKQLLQRLVALDDDLQILVVDDVSPDGTAKLVEAMRAQHPQIHLLSGQKNGIGAAYKRGMMMAIEKLKARIVVQMDADFSHDPNDVLPLIKIVKDGADAAIGSRYIAGGSTDKNWGLGRLLLSGGGNWLVRFVAGIRKVRDCTSGFRAWRSKTLLQAQINDLPMDGYAFQFGLLHKSLQQGAKVVEYPIYFQARSQGETKLGLFDLIEFFVSAWLLRFPFFKVFLKFAVVGTLGLAINLLLFSAFLDLGVNNRIASVSAAALSILSNFFLNEAWTFRHRQLSGRKITRSLKFFVTSISALLMNFSAFLALSTWWSTFAPIICQALAVLPAMLVNYYVNSIWTFKSQ